MFRLKDRRGNDFLLAPTHEEMFTLLVKDLYSSYKDLPLVIYQIQTKYRDEPRPRAGLLRGREFVMKDSYSFDVDDDGLAVSYQRHRDAYIKTFERLGLPFVIVSAMSGAMGGSASEEFLAPIDDRRGHVRALPELRLRRQRRGGAHRPRRRTVPIDDLPPAVVHDTPDTPTIATLVDLLNARDDLARDAVRTAWTAADTLKNVVVMLRHPDGTRSRWRSACPATVTSTSSGSRPRCCRPSPSRSRTRTSPATRCSPRATSARARSASRRRRASASSSTRGSSPARRGSPAPTATATTSIGLVAGRDFTPDGTIDVANVEPGDPCPNCGVAAGDRPGRRDRPHLPARTALRRGARPPRARRRRQGGHRHDGLLRHRRVPGRRRHRRDDVRRARPVLAARRWPRPTSTS